jgi:YVTN family beta-propeller protein
MFNMYTSIESIILNRMVVSYLIGMLVTLLILSSLISIGIFTTKINIRSTIMQNAYASHIQADELSNAPSSSNNSSLSLVQTIPLPNVTGRIDHLGVDKKGQRLFVAELGNNSVDIIDLSGGKRISSVTTGVNEPQGIAFVPELNRLFVANRADGSVDIFDGKTFTLLQTIKLNGDADNIRYDSNNGLVYVGYGNGALAVINATSGEKLGNIRLPGHPESFQIEKFGNKVFVNIPDDDSIIVADKKNLKVISKWTLTSATQNFPMALDEGNHRLFVGFRDPAKVIVYDTESGKEVASFNTARDIDDIFYDAANKQIYISSGEGAVDIFKQRDTDHYDLVNRIQSAQGARTSLLVPELNQLYLAVPEHRGQEAQIQIYEVE